MKPALKIALAVAISLSLTAVAHAQRMSFSIGMPSTASAGAAGGATAHPPPMPSVPSSLISYPEKQVSLRLKPLNLVSTHLAPALRLLPPEFESAPSTPPAARNRVA